MTNDFATELGAAAKALPPGDSMALAETTEFDWDRVYIFAPGTKRSLINESVGVDVYDTDLDERYGLFTERYLAVFTLDGAVVNQGAIPGNFEVLEAELDASAATVSKVALSGGQVIRLGNESN